MNSYPEPPAVGSEVDTLHGSLERQRATFAYKCGELDADQLRVTVAASAITLGGLLKHLAYMEDLNFTRDLAGEELPSPWTRFDPDNRGEQVWRSAAEDSPAELYSLWQDAVSRSRTAIKRAVTEGGPSATFEVQPGVKFSLRRLLVDLIEEYARHTGHADLIRESIDGRVGEDPPGEPVAFALD